MSAMKDPTVKILLLGNGSVGKSSIIQRLTDDGFNRQYLQTVGCDFFERRLKLKGETAVMLQVWDIGGQSIASKMFNQYLHGAAIVVYCYDITDAQSFHDLEDWWQRTEDKFADGSSFTGSKPDMYLLGNKMDLIHQRQVPEKKHNGWIREKELGGGYFVSARSGENVLRVFVTMAALRLGVQMSEYDLDFLDKVVSAEGVMGDDGEGRTAMADQIEAEDRAWEEARLARLEGGQCGCAII